MPSAGGRFFNPRQFALGVLLCFGFCATAFGQCSFTVNPSGQVFVDSQGNIGLGGGPLVVQITASAQTCGWTADASDGFATVTGAHSGTGNGSIQYSMAANTTGADRTTTLQIAGSSVSLTQRWTAAIFSDVAPISNYFNAASLMNQNAITLGCASSPTLQYCGDQNVTRRQMAVFIVRTIYGGGANGNSFNYSTTPYFTDVPVTDVNFKYVQKLRDLGVTSGCTATTYCPDANVTRDQMAVFIVRARLGSTASYTFSPTPYFTDVPANYSPANFFKAIQKLKEIGITSGCSATTYCPTQFVTRGQMAIFLDRAGFNTLFSGSTPLLSSVSPNSGIAGNTVTVTLTGINTNFVQGTTSVSVNNGVTTGTVTVTDATHLTVPLTIPAGTTLGPISLTAITGNEQATIPNGFNVGLGDPLPTISSFTPASGPIGTAVTLTGTGLVSSAGTPSDVRMSLLGGGIGSAPLTASSATSLSFVVPSTAATGNITVAGSSGSATSATAFTVTPSSSFSLNAGPSATNVIAGQQATYTVTIASSDGFTGAAQLSMTGLPTGLTASFSPTQIAVGQQSTLTVTAPAGAATSTSTLVIKAAASVDGLPLSLSTSATLNVTPITTSFLGRTVVDDTSNTSLAGVVVTMVGQDGSGATTGCTGSTVSDASGNFALTNLSTACLGPQLIAFDGNSVTAPAGKYAGLQLVFTLVSNQVVVSPVLVHLPRVDNVETFLVKQNSASDQSYTFNTIPGLKVMVYAGTVFTKQDGTQPDPFPLAAIEVPVDRLPDVMPVTSASVSAYIVAFQPAETNASKAVAVWFPNSLNTPPGTNVPLMTLDPTRGRMVPYGTGTISNDGITIIPDIDPSTGSAQRRFGIVHFDWHGPAVAPPPSVHSSWEDWFCPCSSDPIDLSSGVQVLSSMDLAMEGGRGAIEITRTYVTNSAQLLSFGIGSSFNFDYRIDTTFPNSAAILNVALPNGVQIPFSRRPDGTMTNQTVPSMAGAVVTTAADGSATLKLKTGNYFKFQPGVRFSVLTEMGDLNGNTIKINRDFGSSVLEPITEIVDAVGRKLTFTNSGGLITSITDPMGRTVSYTYNANNYLETFTSVLGGVMHYEYDSQNRLSKVTDPDGVVLLQNTYDATNRVIQQTTPAGGVYKYAYILVNPLVPTSPVSQTVETDPNGNSTTYRFNAAGFMVSVADALGQVRYFDHQSGTNLLLAKHGNGTCPVCGSGDFTYTYDANGNLATQTDALGATVTAVYDPVFSHLTSLTDPLGNVTTMTYDAQGNMASATDARGHTAIFSHDAHGLLISVTSATGKKAIFGWDAQGNQTLVKTPDGQISTSVYDAVSRMIGSIDPSGNQISLAYNPLDELLAAKDANGNQTAFTYDAAGVPLVYKDPQGGVVTLTWDQSGHLVSRKDQQNRAATMTYDPNGNVVSVTNRRGQTAFLAYDALNRIVSEQYADGASVTFTWDAAGHLVRVIDSTSGTFEMAYDVMGRLLKSTGPFGTVTYTRDAAGFVTSRQVTGGPKVTYTYDATQNLTSASMTGASISFSYDANDNIVTSTRSNGVNGQYGFDDEGRLISLAESSTGNASILSRSMSFDASGHLASQSVEAGQALSLQNSSNGFNASNQLGSATGSTFTYDADGNRLTEVSAAGTTSYTWDARGRLQNISAPGGVTTAFLYDFAGNLIQKRVTSTGNDVVERYVLDDLTNVVQQQRVGAGAVSLLTGRAPDQHFATIAGASTVFGITDYNGSTVALTDGSGALASRAYYGPWGDTTTSPSAYTAEFTGRQQVAQNLYYLRARFLDARNGNFLSEDPDGISAGEANLYRYGFGDPVDLSDPSGKFPLAAAAGLGALAGAGGSFLGTLTANYIDGKPWSATLNWQTLENAAIAGGVGAAAGAAAPYVATEWVGALLLGEVANVTQQALQNVLVTHVEVSCGLFQSALTGLLGGAIGGKAFAAAGYRVVSEKGFAAYARAQNSLRFRANYLGLPSLARSWLGSFSSNTSPEKLQKKARFFSPSGPF